MDTVSNGYECSLWPETKNYGCGGGGEWRHLKLPDLDTDLEHFRTILCERLCMLQGRSGCCFVGSTGECAFSFGSKSELTKNSDQTTSVNCYQKGIDSPLFSYSL
jgi:hypothetical protein